MPDSSSRNSIGVLPPISMSAASASTRSRGGLVEHGDRYSWWKASASAWIKRPVSLSPSSCAISDRSSAQPASARPVGHFGHQALPQRTQINPVERHPCESGEADAIGSHHRDRLVIVEFSIHAPLRIDR